MSNTPWYDDKGRWIAFQRSWRKPSLPLRRPRCTYHGRSDRIGWNTYRCPKCATRIQPERLYHRLMLWWNPFRLKGDRDNPLTYLVRVTRLRPVRRSRRFHVFRLLPRRF